MKRFLMKRWVRWLAVGLPLLVLALVGWGYFAFAWIFFVKPGAGGPNLGLDLVQVAGSPEGSPGFQDGPASASRLAKPIRLATDHHGGIVFADINNHAVRLLQADGTVVTLAGGPDRKGHQDGPAGEARFNSPHGVAVRQADGVIAVAEAGNNAIRLLTPVAGGSPRAYVVSTLAGFSRKRGMQDGPNETARFNAPHAVAWSPGGELYVADIGNARIRMLHQGVCSTVAGTSRKGQADGDLATGTLKYPMDLALDASGALWIADAGSLTIRKWTRESGLTTPFPGLRLAMPHGITLGPDGAVIVAELNGQRVLSFNPHDGAVTTLCGTTAKGLGQGRLNRPAAVLADGGKVWIADLGNHRLVRVTLP
jgi:DNA-binding beta-propeller fold protein YncE